MWTDSFKLWRTVPFRCLSKIEVLKLVQGLRQSFPIGDL